MEPREEPHADNTEGRILATQESSDQDIEETKKAVNNLIWMYAPPGTTLHQAEELACRILLEILEGKTQ